MVLGLAALALCGVYLSYRESDLIPTAPAATQPRLAWVFEAPHSGSVVAAPCVSTNTVYLAAAHTKGFQQYGTLYALDRSTGRIQWTFDRDGEMLPTASSPILRAGKLYFGEGMHASFSCRLQCLDANSGKPIWAHFAGDHIEGSPALADGIVVFPAGNDGVIACDSATGEPRWQFEGEVHVDSTPAVAAGRVIVGSGTNRRFQNSQVIALDLHSGKPLWRTPVNLPAWGPPCINNKRVYVGLGNGRLTRSAQPPDKPAGQLVCLDLETGELCWSFSAQDAIFGRAAVAGDDVVIGSRDGFLTVLTGQGTEQVRVDMGGPVVAGPIVVDERIYAVSVPGRVVCLQRDGTELWRYELARPGSAALAFSSPVIQSGQLFVTAELQTGNTGIVTLFCLQLPQEPDS